MRREKTLAAALQLPHDAGLIMSNIQVLGQFVTSLNWMASEIMRVAFDWEPFPSEAVLLFVLLYTYDNDLLCLQDRTVYMQRSYELEYVLRILLLGRGLYIVHETGRRQWSGVA